MKIGKKIRQLRNERRLTQTDLAKILHVSQDTISLWELDKSLPDVKAVVEICKLFDVSSDYLLGLEK